MKGIKKVRSHPWIAKDVPVRGFVFDMETGLLSEVDAAPKQTAVPKVDGRSEELRPAP